MKIGIIGAGFGGLSTAYYLLKNGQDVTVFEYENQPGGLAIGFKEPKWKWTIEKHYHHWFANDEAVIKLAKEIGHKIIFVRPKTSTYYKGKIMQLDSPISLLKFSSLPPVERVRTGVVLAYLKLNPYWKNLEKVTSEKFIKKWMGDASWDVLWRPLFEKKFGKYASEIPASWFWSRIYKRTPSLGYPEGGFLQFAQKLAKEIESNGGKINYSTVVNLLENKEGKIILTTDKNSYKFDKVVCTLPTNLFLKITKSLPDNYTSGLKTLKGLGAVNLLLSLKNQFLKDGTYWLNINDTTFPFLAIVEHTNFMKKDNYNSEHLVYVGNYLEPDHPYFNMEAKDLIKIFLPFLRKINPAFSKKEIINSYVFKTPFAQPIIPLNYSKNIPDFVTPIDGLYLNNIQQVYPWDRGTNYAVENGKKVAELICTNKNE